MMENRASKNRSLNHQLEYCGKQFPREYDIFAVFFNAEMEVSFISYSYFYWFSVMEHVAFVTRA